MKRLREFCRLHEKSSEMKPGLDHQNTDAFGKKVAEV